MKKSVIIWASCLTLVTLIVFSFLFRLSSFEKREELNHEKVNIVSIAAPQTKSIKQIDYSNKQDSYKKTKADATYSHVLEKYALLEKHIKDTLFKDEDSKKIVHIKCNEDSCEMFVPGSASGAERYMYVSAVFLAMYQGMLDSKLQSAGLKRNESSAVSWEKGSLSASLNYENNL